MGHDAASHGGKSMCPCRMAGHQQCGLAGSFPTRGVVHGDTSWVRLPLGTWDWIGTDRSLRLRLAGAANAAKGARQRQRTFADRVVPGSKEGHAHVSGSGALLSSCLTAGPRVAKPAGLGRAEARRAPGWRCQTQNGSGAPQPPMSMVTHAVCVTCAGLGVPFSCSAQSMSPAPALERT
jgi:hypothetical protein